jgi:hypothetical protein
MKKLTFLAGAALLAAGIGSAQAQTVYVGTGYHHRYHGNNGGAVAAGLIGGALIGGLIASAATPTYSYPAYGYPAYGYRTASPAYGYPAYGYRTAAPAYGYGYGSPYRRYTAPVATVDEPYYQPAPVYRSRVVYQQAPVYRSRVVYRQPQVVYRQPRVVNRAFYEQPRVRTRIVYRQDQPRRFVRTNVRRDVVATGSIRDRRNAIRVQYR